MATTFDVLFLGVLPIIDPVEGNIAAENAAGLTGVTVGTAAEPLAASQQQLSRGSTAQGDPDAYDSDNAIANDTFSIDGGPLQTFDSAVRYRATIVYDDGTTAVGTFTILQDVDGRTYLLPDTGQTSDQAALEAKPIRSFTFGDPVGSENAAADRAVAAYTDGTIVQGTTGNDTMQEGFVDGDGDAIDGLSNTIYGDSGDDTVDGAGGNDVVYGGTGADALTGGTGDDSLYGGSGHDTLTGNAGTDFSYGGDGDDTITDGQGTDNRGSTDFAYGGAGNDTIALGGNADYGYGGDGDDTIRGEDGGDNIWGEADNDLIYGGTGNDTVSGGMGRDAVFGDDGDDYVGGGEGNDTLFGGTGNDLVVGDGNAFIPQGMASSPTGVSATLRIVNAADGVVDLYRIDGSGNPIYVQSIGPGETVDIKTDTGSHYALRDPVAVRYVQTIPAGPSQTIVFGRETQDTVFGGDGNDSLHGQYGSDTLDGGAGNDSLFGGTGGDALSGGTGADRLRGGAGDDTLTGGADDDIFGLDRSGGADIITDFDLGDTDGNQFYNDQLDVSTLRTRDGAPVRARDVTVVDDGRGNAKLIFPEGETVVLQGVRPDQMATQGQRYRAGIPCFTPGTRIATARGDRPIESLRPGDLVQTRDNGLQPVVWIGRRVLRAADLAAQPHLRPIRIAAHAFGNPAPLVVSPQHGMLLGGPSGQGTQLVRAVHLARMAGGQARVLRGVRQVTYIHLMFDAHQIVLSGGVPSESFYPGPQALAMLHPPELTELLTLFPDLAGGVQAAIGPRARPVAAWSDLPRHLRALHIAPV